MNPHIGFLLGRRPGYGSVLPKTIDRLRRAGATVTVQMLDSEGALSPELRRAGLVVLRGLDAHGLTLAEELAADGVRLCNSVESTRTARDKEATSRVLRSAGVPVPASTVTTEWAAARSAAGSSAVVVKAVRGSRGTGVLLAPDGDLPAVAPFDGPYLVQEWIAGNGYDRKLYAVGGRVSGVQRRWPPRDLTAKIGRTFEPTEEEQVVARTVGAVMGLEIFGVDVLHGPQGPVVVDVNAFPGFKGVPEVDRSLAVNLLALSRRKAVPCAS